MNDVDPFERLLQHSRGEIQRYVEKRAGGALIRMESSEDLAQDICARALRHRGTFEWRDEVSFRAWLFEIARNHIEDRRDYWSALKRAGTDLLRMGAVDSRDASWRELSNIAASVTGPSTFAVRREQLALAAKSLALLLPKDRTLVEGIAAGQSTQDQATQLGLSVPATESARKRALERLRKTFKLVAGERGSSS
jgi:RNA polymerase sigma factor (sigma-70 family)